MKKVLIVEDGEDIQTSYQGALRSKVEVLSAYSLEEGRQLFSEHHDLDAIVMDACVDNIRTVDSDILVKEFRKSFSGPMIAASGVPEFGDFLVEAGCDFKSPKGDVPEKLLEVLGEN